MKIKYKKALVFYIRIRIIPAERIPDQSKINGKSPYVSLKKSREFFRVAGTPGNYFKIQWQRETLPCTYIQPLSPTYGQHNFVITDWKISYAERIRKFLGFKMNIIQKR